jgi:plastocyanin
MSVRRSAAVAGVTLALAVSSTLSGAWPGLAAGPTTYRIGVDNAAPHGHNWLYVDFFPRTGLKVHKGDVLDFSWDTGSADGFHNVSVQPATTGNSLITPDLDDPASPAGPQLELNPAILFPAPPTCGTAASPCDYTGARVNSGAQPTAPGFEYFVKVNVDAGTTLNFLCEVHPGMRGSLQVVQDSEPATTLAELRARARDQFREDTKGALNAEEATERDAAVAHEDGTRSLTVTAGTATPFVEVAEMLPRNVEVRPGDSVQWATRTIKDVHTVTFPQGHGSDGVDPLPLVCEGVTDTPASTAGPPCTPITLLENHVNPQPQGATSITSSTTVGSSGVLAAPPAPNAFSFTFPNAGTFTYQCRVHDHMVGMVEVER